MTHKYDVQQFAKLLEEYRTEDELREIRAHLNLNLQQPMIMGGDDDNQTVEDNEEEKGDINGGDQEQQENIEDSNTSSSQAAIESTDVTK